jgi:hypothetical protein
MPNPRLRVSQGSPSSSSARSIWGRPPRRWLLLWGLVRLPLLLLGLYLGRQVFLDWIERVVGVGGLTQRAIALISTFPERLLLFGLVAFGLAAILASGAALEQWGRGQEHRQQERREQERRGQKHRGQEGSRKDNRGKEGRGPKSRRWDVPKEAIAHWSAPQRTYLLPIGLGLGLWLILFAAFSHRRASLVALGLTGLLALNTVPAAWIKPWQTAAPWVNWTFGLLPGIECLLPRPFGLWLWGLAGRQPHRRLQTGLTAGLIVVLAALTALALPTPALIELGHRIHAEPAVQMIDRGNINMLALNPQRRWLYASGHGLKYFRAYNLDALNQPPRQSLSPSDYIQGFAYDAPTDRIYFYHKASQTLRVMDGTSLTVQRTIPVPPISPGDSWVAWDPLSQTVTIASEADQPVGTPFVVVDPKTAKVVHTSNLSPSYLFRSPSKPRLYMNSFRRTTELIAYDPQSHRIVKQVDTDQQVDRMALVAARNELLVTSPVNAQVLRYDADTLARRGAIATTFGVRSVAVDTQRNLLLAGSLATNMLEVIDLNTQKRRATYRLGPWLREICLDTGAGVAYVSSNGALYKVDYTAKL